MSGFEPVEATRPYEIKHAEKVAVGQTHPNVGHPELAVTFMLLAVGEETWSCLMVNPPEARQIAARLLNRADEVEAHNAKCT